MKGFKNATLKYVPVLPATFSSTTNPTRGQSVLNDCTFAVPQAVQPAGNYSTEKKKIEKNLKRASD